MTGSQVRPRGAPQHGWAQQRRWRVDKVYHAVVQGHPDPSRLAARLEGEGAPLSDPQRDALASSGVTEILLKRFIARWKGPLSVGAYFAAVRPSRVITPAALEGDRSAFAGAARLTRFSGMPSGPVNSCWTAFALSVPSERSSLWAITAVWTSSS